MIHAPTREAISQWQHSKNRNPIGVLADAEASALEEEASKHGQTTATERAKPPVPEIVAREKPAATANSPTPLKSGWNSGDVFRPLRLLPGRRDSESTDARHTRRPEVPTVIAAAVEFIPGLWERSTSSWRCAKGGVSSVIAVRAHRQVDGLGRAAAAPAAQQATWYEKLWSWISGIFAPATERSFATAVPQPSSTVAR